MAIPLPLDHFHLGQQPNRRLTTLLEHLFGSCLFGARDDDQSNKEDIICLEYVCLEHWSMFVWSSTSTGALTITSNQRSRDG